MGVNLASQPINLENTQFTLFTADHVGSSVYFGRWRMSFTAFDLESIKLVHHEMQVTTVRNIPYDGREWLYFSCTSDRIHI